MTVRIIGKLKAKSTVLAAPKTLHIRLHTRSIVRDGSWAFVGSQSLRSLELDARREVGIIFRDPKAVARLAKTFEEDWEAKEQPAAQPISAAESEQQGEASAAKLAKQVAKAVVDDMPPVKPVFELTVRELSGSAPDVKPESPGNGSDSETSRQGCGQTGGSRFRRRSRGNTERGDESMKLMAVAAILMAGVLGAQTGHPAVNADSAIMQDFEKRVAAYLQLRKSIESSLPKLKTTPSQEKISHHEVQLRHAIREARKDARPGDIFTPEIAAEIRRLIAMAMQPADGNHIAQSLRHAEPVQLHLEINDKLSGAGASAVDPSLAAGKSARPAAGD